jgi:hypothetical protein
MEAQQKKRVQLLVVVVVFAVLILWAFLRAKGTTQ